MLLKLINIAIQQVYQLVEISGVMLNQAGHYANLQGYYGEIEPFYQHHFTIERCREVAKFGHPLFYLYHYFE
jgi:hypothetical protein